MSALDDLLRGNPELLDDAPEEIRRDVINAVLTEQAVVPDHDLLWGVWRLGWPKSGRPIPFRTEEQADRDVAASHDGKSVKVYRSSVDQPWRFAETDELVNA